MKISLVTDEISSDVETAIELGLEWGVRDFELRGIGLERVPCLSAYPRQHLTEVLEQAQVGVAAVSPGLFKCAYPRSQRESFPVATLDAELHQRWRSAGDLVRYHQEELLPLSLEFARHVGARRVVIFGFHRGGEHAGPAPDEVLRALAEAAEQAGAAGLQLAIEVEGGFWADTGQRTRAMVDAIAHPALMINWDPGNALAAGETPYPDGYAAVRGRVGHVHVKDARREPQGGCRYVLDGEIDWPGQVRALAGDGYDGFLSVETHLRPKVSSARATVERLRTLIAGASAEQR